MKKRWRPMKTLLIDKSGKYPVKIYTRNTNFVLKIREKLDKTGNEHTQINIGR